MCAEAQPLYYLGTLRWIDFSEGDGKRLAEGASISGRAAVPFANALRTTRSTNILWQQADSLVKLANMKIYRGFPERLYH